MGIITRLGLHDPSVWPVTAICAVPVVLCVYTCARYLSSSPEVCVDKSNPEPNRRLTLEDVKDNRFVACPFYSPPTPCVVAVVGASP